MKKYIIGFIIGAIIFSGISAFATAQILASNISYKNTTVESAIDTLYTKAKPDYSGDTTFTPTTSSQTIQTNNKILKSDITINPIPSTYKELSTATTVTANDLLNGITAYDNLGNLITGSINTDCVSGVYTKPANTATNINIGFTPKKFQLIFFINTNKHYVIYNADIDNDSKDMNVKTIDENGQMTGSIGTNTYTINDNHIVDATGTTTNNRYILTYPIYYMACK